jgi:hypothetical protein
VFIQVIQGKCNQPDTLRSRIEDWRQQRAGKAEGWLGGTYGFTDDGTFVGVIRFESEEKARANSASREQSQWWAETEKCFDGPVTFHDADKVMVMLGGGSDDAEFVQVIQGKIDDPALLEAEYEEMNHVLQDERPDILGATLALEKDGTFTETVAFTNEAAAREGESKAMPTSGRARELLEDWDRHTHDVQYLDLHHPWFASKA